MTENQKGRPADKVRVLRTLLESDGLSNSYIRTELNLTDQRYAEIKAELLTDGMIENYRCRGGGVWITKEGEKSLKGEEPGPISSVDREKDLYEPLVKYLEKQSEEDGVNSLPINTASLRAKGKWQNPDVTRLTFEYYQYLRKTELIVTTYEVKQWGGWDVGAVFEATAHKRFAHQAIVVLEWSKDAEFSLSDPTYKLDELSRECRRFGIGLSTLRRHYSTFRLHTHISPVRHNPLNADVELWLEYVFSRNPAAQSSFEQIWAEISSR